MQYEISNRMSDVHGSAIRELFKLGADPNMISFGGGNPSAETFPVPEIADIIADVMKDAPVSVLQYGLSEGYTPLRDTMKDYLTRTQGFDFENNELFILSGGQQCADLTTKVLVNEGDIILTEDPAFVGCLNTFRSYGAKLIGIPMQQDGMDTDALEAALKAHPEAKLLYTIPSFQNPSGITTTLEKRKKVYELACKYDIAILEDNPYGELRFSGEDVPDHQVDGHRRPCAVCRQLFQGDGSRVPTGLPRVQQVAHHAADHRQADHRCALQRAVPVRLQRVHDQVRFCRAPRQSA